MNIYKKKMNNINIYSSNIREILTITLLLKVKENLTKQRIIHKIFKVGDLKKSQLI